MMKSQLVLLKLWNDIEMNSKQDVETFISIKIHMLWTAMIIVTCMVVMTKPETTTL